VTDNLFLSIWASAKTVQAKDQETLPVFPDFQKNRQERQSILGNCSWPRHIAPSTLSNPPLTEPYPQDTVLGTRVKRHSQQKGPPDLAEIVISV